MFANASPESKRKSTQMVSWKHRKFIKIASRNGLKGIWGAPTSLTCNMMCTKGGRGNPAAHLFRDLGVAWVLSDPNWAPRAPQKPCKINRKIDAKIDAGKVMKKTWKSMENVPQNDPGNNEKSMRFRTPRFLVFCQEYNVKTVFYMISATRNLSNFNKNIM